MKIECRWYWKSWLLLPTISVRTRSDLIMIGWLCLKIWIGGTWVSRSWSSKHFCVTLSHTPTHLSFPSVEINFGRQGNSICIKILGLSLCVYYEDDDLPF